MRIFTVIAAAAGLVLSVAVAYAHEPPEWTSDVMDEGGPPAWVDDVKTDGGPPAFVETNNGTIGDDAPTDADASAPPSTQSEAETRIQTGLLAGNAARTASNTSRGKRIRFSRLPPYLSSRLFESGDRNSCSRYPWAP